MTERGLETLIVRARGRLRRAHRALLEQLGVQEAIVDNWPADVRALYETVGETPPRADHLAGAVAVWLQRRRVVAFNAGLLRRALADDELTEATVQTVVDNIAWHENGHALSATLASSAMKSSGPRLVELLPPGLRRAIDYPGCYRRGQVFDEVIANVYALMISRAVHHNDYRVPEFIDPAIAEAFWAVMPWSPPNHE